MRLPTVNAMKWVILGIVIMALAAGLGRPAYAQGQVISGTVMSGSTPLASGTVQAYVGSTLCGSGQISSGMFSLILLPGCGSVNTPVIFTVNNTQPAVASPQVLYTGSGSNNVVLTTFPGTTTGTGHTISGTVIGAAGPPTPGTTVEALIGGNVCVSTFTDASGGFFFVVPSTCAAYGSSINFRVGGQLVPQIVLFQNGGFSSITLSLGGTTTTTGAHAISGTVVNNTGAPVPAAVVEALIGNIACAHAVTGGDGTFTLIVPSWTQVAGCGVAKATISFRVNGQAVAQTVVFETGGTSTITLITGGTATVGGHSISGTVMAPNNTPVINAVVEALIGGQVCGSATTSATGTFNLIVASSNQQPGCGVPGSTINYRVSGQILGQMTSFQLGGFSFVNLTFSGTVAPTTQVAGHTVSGAVVSGTGAAVPNTTVQALVGSTVCATATTDANGRFTLVVPPAGQQAGCGVNGTTISFRVGNQAVTQTLVFQSGGTATITLPFSPTTAAATTTPSTGAATTTVRVNQWLDRPPTSAGTTPGCPAPGSWELRYWGGDTPIAVAAAVCPNVTVLWVRRSDRWLGFAKAAPGASDSWDVVFGEAHFLFGG